MIEDFCKDRLEQALGVKVYKTLPEDLPGTFIFLERAGSSERDFIRTARIYAAAYGPSIEDAARLSEQIRTEMRELCTDDNIISVRINAGSNSPDTVRKRQRYQVTFDITYYEE